MYREGLSAFGVDLGSESTAKMEVHVMHNLIQNRRLLLGVAVAVVVAAAIALIVVYSGGGSSY